MRHGLDDAELVALFGWTEAEFDARTRGSAIRRIGYERWSRNLAVGLGNAPHAQEVVAALAARADDPSPVVREHVAWALAQQAARAGAGFGGAARRLSAAGPARRWCRAQAWRVSAGAGFPGFARPSWVARRHRRRRALCQPPAVAALDRGAFAILGRPRAA